MKSFDELSPSNIRKIILEEHALLRIKLKEIDSVIKIKDAESLIRLLREAINYLLVHMAHEEKILRPTLNEIDAWGAVRVDIMNNEHKEQRKEIEKFMKLLEGAKISQICKIQKGDKVSQWNNLSHFLIALQKFMDQLHLDMNQEEHDFLNSDLLKDDPITVGSFSG